MTDHLPAIQGRFSRRDRLAVAVIVSSIALLACLVGFAAYAMYQLSKPAPAKGVDGFTIQVFGLLLPLIGTWVGTILAFYFSKENFESASRAQAEVLKGVSPRLESIPASSVMLPFSDIRNRIVLDGGRQEKDVTVDELRQALQAPGVSRLIVQDQGGVRYVIHDSVVYRDIALYAEPARTLADLLSEQAGSTTVSAVARAFRMQPASASLADCQRAMQGDCRDVFITPGGATSGTPLGWITDRDVSRHARA